MPKINTTIFKEGDVIRKSDITSVADEIEAIDTAIDEDNLREEGLDRRVFDTHPWTSFSNTPVVLGDPELLPRVDNWSVFGPVGTIEIPWNILNDSDVIIRCSFFIESQGGNLGAIGALVENDDWEFGLHVTHPDEGAAGWELLPRDTYGGGIWPYARISLSKAFQRHAKMGGDGVNAPGSWYQHAFTRESQISQSVTLVYHAHCRVRTESIPTSTKFDRSHVWNASGSARATLAYRSRYVHTGLENVKIRGLHLSYQKFRR